MIKKPTVFNINPGIPFLDSLAAGIFKRYARKPENLINLTVLLPTRRACRSLSTSFLTLTNGRSTLLPKMIPLGDIDEDEMVLTGDDLLAKEHSFEVAPAIPSLHRQLLLTRLIMARQDNKTSTDQATILAQELARLLDQIQTEQLSFYKINDLVKDKELSIHWQKTLKFLTILTKNWPSILAQHGVIDPAVRRNIILKNQTKLWQQKPPSGPIIAAGSTGSIPATADLLKTISQMDNGAVILPGLDKEADELVWESLEPSHPQYGMAKLLKLFQIERSDVANWESPIRSVAPASRARLLNQALIPAKATNCWQTKNKPSPKALLGTTLIESYNEKEEAGMIAVALRQALEIKGKTAALVTPNRTLARRVAAELRRWKINIDDSAGQPLAKTPPGTFMRQCAHLAAGGLTPSKLLNLLKHPYAAGGMNTADLRKQTRLLEKILRCESRPKKGFTALKASIARSDQKEIQTLKHLINRLEKITTPFSILFDKPQIPLKDLLVSHVQFAEELATTKEKKGPERLWEGKDGEALALFFAELNDAANTFGSIETNLYPALIDVLIGIRVHRPVYGNHPRLHIWGLLEARLQHADLMILGGLNENCWPPDVKASPWMSRPMLEKFGLSQPERRIGLAAHDFTQAASAKEIIFSRAERSGGSPTVPSRWLQRIKTLIKGTQMETQLQQNQNLDAFFAMLDRPKAYLSPTEPLPTPPLKSRPRKLSVSRMETWIRDPYSIYAQYVLKLEVLNPINEEAGAADLGIVVHKALDSFIKKFSASLPSNAFEELLNIGAHLFDMHVQNQTVHAFWWPRFERIAQWFVDNERLKRQEGRIPLSTETSGKITFKSLGGDFTLNARADRIDITPDGNLAIIDYKTGGVPTKKQIKSGLTPQLTLEAAIAANGKYKGIKFTGVSDLIYMRLTGGNPPGEESGVFEHVESLAADALLGLKQRVASFDDETTPYLSRPVPQFLNHFGDYDHLARVKEWMTGDESDEGDQ